MKISIPGALLPALLLAIPSPALADRLSDARKLMERGAYRTAAERIREVTGKAPDDAGAWTALARCLLRLQDLEAAEEAAYKALDLDEEDGGTWRLVGEVAFEKGVRAFSDRQASNVIKSWFAEAEAKFKQALRRSPEDPQIRWWLGWAKQWQEYPERARKYYEEQIEKFPKEPGGYLRLGSLLISRAGSGLGEEAQGLRREAVAAFDEGLKAAGEHAETLYQRGLALEWLGEKDGARESYVRAIRADPDFWKAWTRLEKLRVPAAVLLPLAKEALKKDPKNATAAMWSTYFLAAEGEYEEALKVALPALREHFEHRALYDQALGAALQLLRENPEAAAAAFERLHEYYPFSGSAANNLGLYHRDRTKNYRKSLEWYLKAMEREPENQDILNDTALIYLFHLKGQEKKSLPIFLKVISLVTEGGQAPVRGFWDACENLCRYYWDVERDREKVIYYAKLRTSPYRGVEPYSRSRWADHYRQLAEK